MVFMRAGPLSDDRVIDIFNHYFIPVSVSNDAYTKGEVSPAENAEKIRIVRESWLDTKVLRTGEDALYVLDSNGRVVDAIRAPDSIRIDKVLPFLEAAVKSLGVSKGPTLVTPTNQSKPPATKEGDIVLHLTARYVPKGEGWAKIPAEDWIVLTDEEWSRLLPDENAAVGQRWDIDKAVAKKLMLNFYPPTGNTNVNKNKIERLEFTGTLVSLRDGRGRVRLDGALKMKHPFFTTGVGPSASMQQGKDYDVVIDSIVGFVDFETSPRRLTAFRLVGEKATYDKKDFVLALRNHKPAGTLGDKPQ
jgi:hypothetical protein